MLADALQVAGLALLALGVGFAFGWALGACVVGAGLFAYGVAAERGQ